MSPNNGNLFTGVLRTRLLNNPFASCFFINFDFLQTHTAHFDDNLVLPFLVFNTFGSKFSLFFLHFKQIVHFKENVNIFYND